MPNWASYWARFPRAFKQSDCQPCGSGLTGELPNFITLKGLKMSDYSQQDKLLYAALELSKGSYGGFATHIGEAMIRADLNNSAILHEAFFDLFEQAWLNCPAYQVNLIAESV